MLRAYASQGSISHGRLAPERLAAILRGAPPADGEIARLRQAMLETPAACLGPLAEELDLPLPRLERRLMELFGLDIRGLDRMQHGGVD